MSRRIVVRVPATTANLGPGFDVLGLALDLWNEVAFTVEEEAAGAPGRWEAVNEGFGAAHLPTDAAHLALRAFRAVFERLGRPLPARVYLHARNAIPVASGLGSSAAAVVAGVLAANAALGEPMAVPALLALATALEGHPDNVVPALLGGLTAAWMGQGGAPQALALPLAPAWQDRAWLAVAVPQVALRTVEARRALPAQVPHADAVFNLSRLAVLLEALRLGREDWLAEGVEDRLHQPYRWPLLPGAEAVRRAALEAGAVAVALSGAGPGVVAFAPQMDDATPVADAMVAAWREQGVAARGWALRPAMTGAQV
ncbi:MAG TPA: homoserine kinase [Anaerolineaceae bacterium]|nr:homoserine kinase [Anaerolineales bacterium]HIQ09344.1 homoserine kinase [Anaerolineaceae bacterium]